MLATAVAVWITASFAPAWFGKPWEATIWNDGRVVIKSRERMIERRLSADQIKQLSLALDPFNELQPQYIATAEDQNNHTITVNEKSVQVYGTHLICAPETARFLTVWRLIVRDIRPPDRKRAMYSDCR